MCGVMGGGGKDIYMRMQCFHIPHKFEIFADNSLLDPPAVGNLVKCFYRIGACFFLQCFACFLTSGSDQVLF